MPTTFAQRFQARHGRLAKRFGERVLITPRQAGRYTAGADDTSRAPREVTAIFSEMPADQRTDGDTTGGEKFGFKLPAEKTVMALALADFASPDDWPRKDDRVTRLDEAGQPQFDIVKVTPDGVSELICPLAEVRE